MKLITRQELLLDLKKYSLDINKKVLMALDVAYEAHKDQLRDSGNHFLEEHIYPLATQVLTRHENNPKLVQILIVTILHDVVEDSDISEGYISETFGNEIKKAVLAVTKKKVVLKEKPNQEMLYTMNKKYLEKVAKSGEIAIIVKLEDRLQNLESITSNYNYNKKEKYVRMLDEVRNLFVPLSEKISPKFGYKTLLENEIERINNILKNS